MQLIGLLDPCLDDLAPEMRILVLADDIIIYWSGRSVLPSTKGPVLDDLLRRNPEIKSLGRGRVCASWLTFFSIYYGEYGMLTRLDQYHEAEPQWPSLPVIMYQLLPLLLHKGLTVYIMP